MLVYVDQGKSAFESEIILVRKNSFEEIFISKNGR